MGDHSKIEWTDATWNPIAGCTIVSKGCTNCYAMKQAARIERMGTAPHYAGLTRTVNGNAVWTGRIAVAPEHILTQPLRWKKPRRIFVNSMSDLFHEDVPDAVMDRVFAVMALCPQHVFQVLTKRPERMREYLDDAWTRRETLGDLMRSIGGDDQSGWYAPESDGKRGWAGMHLPLPNVWLGTSVEDQAAADERIPHLLATPAAVRFISAEPLLGPVDLRALPLSRNRPEAGRFNALGTPLQDSIGLPKLGWVVVGGESGPGARPMHPDWARSLRDQCAAAGVGFFFKQWGGWAPICVLDDDVVDGLYHPAPAHDPEAIRRCKVEHHVLHADGSRHDVAGPMAYAAGSGAMLMFETGKHRAGRLLDGAEHNGFPEVHP